MIRNLPAALAVTGLLSACATAPAGPHGPPMADNGNDCAVIAAVAREHYRFNAADRVAPPLWLHDDGSGWAPRCDWGRYGLSFPQIYDPDRPGRQWVEFRRPMYDGHGATIESGIMHGPLAGMGVRCTLVSGFAGWTVTECRSTWVS